MAWNILRTLTTQAAEGAVTPPAPSSFVTVSDGYAEYIEVRFKSIVFAGSPDSVTLSFWREDEGEYDKVAKTTLTAVDGVWLPVIVDFQGVRMAVQVDSFPNGTSPTVSGIVQFREVKL